MCTSYSGGLLYSDGCRKKTLSPRCIPCKLRPVTKDGEPGDEKKCRNYLFVDFGFHKILSLPCPEHESLEVDEVVSGVVDMDARTVVKIERGEDEGVYIERVDDGRRCEEVTPETSCASLCTSHSRYESSGSDDKIESEDNEAGGNGPRPEETLRMTRFLSSSTSHFQDSSTERDSREEPDRESAASSERSGTWPLAGLKLSGRLKGRMRHRRKSLGSMIPVPATIGVKPNTKTFFPAHFNSTSITEDGNKNKFNKNNTSLDETSTSAAYARFITRLPPSPIKDQGRANRPRSHTRNKSAQVLGLKDEIVDGMSGRGLGINRVDTKVDESNRIVAALDRLGFM